MKTKVLTFFLIFSGALMAENVTIKKTELMRLTGIADEYVKVASQKEAQVKFEKLEESKLRVVITIAKDLKYADDIIYETIVDVGNREIMDIKTDGSKVYLKLRDKEESSTFDGKSALFGGGIGATIATIICLIILL